MPDAAQKLQRVPALAVSIGAGSAIAIRSAAAAARFSLRMSADDTKAAGIAAGFNLDIPLNTCAGSLVRCSIRLGPDEWLLIDGECSPEAIAIEIEVALSRHFHALVDIGHRNAAIDISGRHASEVLNSGCPLDLADSSFPAGAATRTILGRAEIILIRFAGASNYCIECGRSFAPYVFDFLTEAARELGVT
jgi:sarcosine oxidase, subunit gamma